jgi:hypothetical protein
MFLEYWDNREAENYTGPETMVSHGSFQAGKWRLI